MTPGRWALLAAVVLAARLAHSGVIWVEEAYPAAAAVQILGGAVPYRDFIFDKPPLAPLIYAAWGAWPGVAARLVGAAYVLLCAWLADRLAGWRGAVLNAFFLTFYVPAATVALAPDLLMVAPHLAAFLLLERGRPMWAGAMAGVAMALHTKGLFVLAPLLALRPAAAVPTCAGFAAVTGATMAALAGGGALEAYWRQVWEWGAAYARDPLPGSGLARTAAWLGFHSAAVVCAVGVWRREWKLAIWFAIALGGALLGGRYFPRYYFLPLVPLVVAAARSRATWPLVLLAIPLLRFGPQFVRVSGEWADTAMSRDAHQAASIIRGRMAPNDTILVWGYRPEILWETRLPLGSGVLDSQPLTGVLADRHLSDSRPTFPAAAAERARLATTRPTWVVDGLGPYNPDLAITRYPDLAKWLALYGEVGRTRGCVVYRLR
jgi:hypothetical protein